MPELPEVEAVKIGLEQLVTGKTIKNVAVFWPRIIERPEADFFKTQLINESIEGFDRRGKFLIFKLTHYDLISHLRMEGKYEYHQQEDELLKHTHVVFQFTDNSELRYLDVRKFGRMILMPKNQAGEYPGIKKLGPEPVREQFHLQEFENQLKKSHRAVKPLLLDQSLVTGLGNIYVDEALFQVKIHPERSADTLNQQDISLLYESIIDVLARAVKAGGTTVRTYKNALGEAGKFQVALNVYGLTGEPCPRCGTPISKIKVAQRGTHFCPNCQKK